MKEFRYSFFAKLVYRYANIPITLLLTFYIILSAVGISENWIYIFPLLINFIVLYLLNRYYFKMYKMFPYTIRINNEKMICTGFMNKDRKVEINLLDIEQLTGGIFSGNPIKPIYIHDGKQNITIGFNHHLKDFNKLLTIILSNIKQDLYSDTLERIKENTITAKRQKKKDKKNK